MTSKNKNFICKDGASNYYVSNSGMGGFLNPPNDAEHKFSIVEKRGGHEVGLYSLRSCLKESWIPREVKHTARYLLNHNKPDCNDETWIQSVYNYFRSCYSPDGIDRNWSNCKIIKNNDCNPEWHLAVLHIREFDANHTPRLDLIANSGPLGSWHKSS